MSKHKGFFDDGDGIFKDKGLSALIESRASRAQIVALFGGVENLPCSVMVAEKNKRGEHDKSGMARSYYSTGQLAKVETTKRNKLPKIMANALRVSGSGCGAGALSGFPQNIVRSMVLLYTNPGDLVFSPFAGHNGEMEATIRTGRHYTGCDLSTEFMHHNFDRAKILRKEFPAAKIKLYHTDSRDVPVGDSVADFTLTSPPYYAIEHYGDEPEQLGRAGTYEGFLDGLQLVMAENYRVLKPGAHCSWFVNDFRHKGKFHLYHIDVIDRMARVGFVPHDILIVDRGSSIRECFTNQIIQQRILPKRHEYGLIFKKPV